MPHTHYSSKGDSGKGASGMAALRAAMMAQMKGAVNVPGASMVGRGKAREILKHGSVHGRPLTRKQRGLFGVIAGGGRPTRVKRA